MLREKIGNAAMLEQTAEEAVELAFACLKLARFMRGENKVYNTSYGTLVANLMEEMADVDICFEELKSAKFCDDAIIADIHKEKRDRMKKRLEMIDQARRAGEDYAKEDPKGEKMEFPATFAEFVESYKIIDVEEVYTNGSDLIPVIRVQQWMAHLLEEVNDAIERSTN